MEQMKTDLDEAGCLPAFRLPPPIMETFNVVIHDSKANLEVHF